MSLGETPWVEKNLKIVLPRLHGRVPDSWLPRTITERTEEVRRGPDWTTTYETKKFKKPVFEEYGCGHYGCVLPTHEPGLVIKLTSDISEARFVARAMELEPTPGIVEYKKIFGLETSHKGRPLFVLWRTEASSVGKWDFIRTHGADVVPGSDQAAWVKHVEREASQQLGGFLSWAKAAQGYLKPKLISSVADRQKLLTRTWQLYEHSEPAPNLPLSVSARLKGMDRVGMVLRTCLYIAQEMTSNESLYKVGEALQHYLEEGILLADVHGNNIGLDADNIPIITDPGHAVEFHPRWAQPPQIMIL
jgi:hypothetical protein